MAPLTLMRSILVTITHRCHPFYSNPKVGDTIKPFYFSRSHVRYLKNQVSQIYYNLTYGRDGCAEKHVEPPDLLGNNFSRFHHHIMSYGRKWTQLPVETIIGDSGAPTMTKSLFSYGQWVASASKRTLHYRADLYRCFFPSLQSWTRLRSQKPKSLS
jgi:hypothetical protein